MTARFVGCLAATALLLAACGSDDSDDSSNASTSEVELSTTAIDPAQPEGGDGGGGSATVELDGESYDFSSAVCTLDVAMVSFEEGGDRGTITATGDGVVLVRLEVGGGQWVDDGDPPTPELTEDTFAWSGPMSELESGDQASVTINGNC